MTTALFQLSPVDGRLKIENCPYSMLYIFTFYTKSILVQLRVTSKRKRDNQRETQKKS